MRLIFDGFVTLLTISSIVAFSLLSFATTIIIFSITFLFVKTSKYIFKKNMSKMMKYLILHIHLSMP
jgi:hypothetical protein